MACQRCGAVQRPVDVAYLTVEETRILAAIRELRITPRTPVRAAVLADFLTYSDRSAVYKHLARLRARGLVDTPLGKYRGWCEVL